MVKTRFKEKKKEVFLGSLRCDIDEKTEKELSGHILDHYWDCNGVRFFHFKDGSIEIRTWKELIEEGLAILEAKKLG